MLQVLLLTIACSLSLLIPYWLPRTGLAIGIVLLAFGVRWSVFAVPDEWFGAELGPVQGIITVVVAAAWITLALGVLLFRHLMRFARTV